MLRTRSFRALAGAAVALLLFAALMSFGITSFAARGNAAGDCTTDPAFDAEEQAFLMLINNYRAQNGLAPLSASYTLSKAAQWKSQDMAANNYFAHDDLTRTWVTRIRDCGYGYNAWLGENIAAGIGSAQAAFDLWRSSAGHNANMLGANYNAIGIGRAYAATSAYGWYWTTEFGSYADGWPGGVPTPAPSGTPTSTQTPAPTSTSTPPNTPTAIPTSAPAPTLHVGDLDGTSIGKSRWSARVAITVHGFSEEPVGGVTVTGRWNGTTPSNCVTDSSGNCSVQSPKLPSSTRSASFTVTGLSAPGAIYAATANHDVDGGTNGTAITVSR